MKTIRTLQPNDIELRVADKNNKGQVHILMYITSRSATNLLDETYGMENYNIEYMDVAGQIYCKLSVWDEEHQRYVVRMDTGEEAKIAADKSLASDALKRVIVRLGVTELYSGPTIYLEDDGYGNRGLKVLEITYDDNRNINHLVIGNKFGKEIFRWDEGKSSTTTTKTMVMSTKAPQQKNTSLASKDHSIDECKNICYTLYSEYLATGQYDANSLGAYWKGKQDWVEKCGGWNGDWGKYCRDDFAKQVQAGKVRMAA